MSINKRVKQLVELEGNPTKFSKKAIVSVQTIAHTINGDGQVKSDTLKAILEGYPNLNARWLLTGEGEMWMDGQAPNTILQFPNTTRQNQGSNNILIPIRAHAGYVVEYGQEKLPNALQSVIIPGITGEARTWEIEGTSMEPMIMEGDWVSGHRVASAQHMIGGNIYVLVTRSSGIHIKHAWLRGSRVYCQPANYTQEPYYIDAEDLVEIWDAKVRVTRNLLVPYPVAAVDKDQAAKWLLPVVRIEGPEEDK